MSGSVGRKISCVPLQSKTCRCHTPYWQCRPDTCDPVEIAAARTWAQRGQCPLSVGVGEDWQCLEVTQGSADMGQETIEATPKHLQLLAHGRRIAVKYTCYEQKAAEKQVAAQKQELEVEEKSLSLSVEYGV